MMAWRPTSDSCISSERSGETLLWPAVPMKSPIRLMSGLRSFALPDAPPKVCVCATCAAAEAGEEGSIPGSGCEAARRTCGPEDGSGDFVSRSCFSSLRKSATSPARVRTCASRAFMRASSVFTAETSRLIATEDASWAWATEENNSKTDRAANRFMTLLLEFDGIEPLLQARRRQPREKRRKLPSGRGAGRGGARNCRGYQNNQRSDFQPVCDRQEGKVGRLSGDD